MDTNVVAITRYPFAYFLRSINCKNGCSCPQTQRDAEPVSKDLQDTQPTITFHYNILPEKANCVCQNLSERHKDRITDPAAQEVVKAVTDRYTAVELMPKKKKQGHRLRHSENDTVSATASTSATFP